MSYRTWCEENSIQRIKINMTDDKQFAMWGQKLLPRGLALSMVKYQGSSKELFRTAGLDEKDIRYIYEMDLRVYHTTRGPRVIIEYTKRYIKGV